MKGSGADFGQLCLVLRHIMVAISNTCPPKAGFPSKIRGAGINPSMENRPLLQIDIAITQRTMRSVSFEDNAQRNREVPSALRKKSRFELGFLEAVQKLPT